MSSPQAQDTGDAFADPLPAADVITLSFVLHNWNLERKLQLIRSACAALPAGGALVLETFIDDERRVHAHGLLTSLSMLVEYGDAFDFTGRDFAGWATDAGFSRVEIVPLAIPAKAGIAYK